MERKVLATINGREISNIDLDNAIRTMHPQQQMRFQSEEGKKRLLDDLVNQELFYVEALENKVEETEEFKALMEQVTVNMLKQHALNQLFMSAMPTEEEAKAYFEEHQDEFKTDEMAKAKHILIKATSDDEFEAAEKRAKEIAEEIKSGEKTFEQAAMDYSDCPSNMQGGDLGLFGKGQMVPEFEEAVFTMNEGELSEPVKTQFGYHIIKVEERHEAGVSKFEEVKDEILGKLSQVKQLKAYEEKVAELREKYASKFTLNK
ncbi:peptidylprolyl isomerase [Peptacetobacter sp.]|uniref:peptidylprolyl isomerase n=1 Tax=Peptacetobacter sp. TaxID=2991975 RepID=UPI00263294DE|nr:peptidylprolyl isomerase [Peptacetobacter sp.]